MKTIEIKKTFLRDYLKEQEKGLGGFLKQGKRWDLSQTLKEGGGAIFPHAFISKCGDQIAAVVHGCFDSGADQILALGVYHTQRNAELEELKLKELRGENLTDSPYRGVFDQVEGEYSLLHFRALLQEEARRRGSPCPRLIERYPSLVCGSPETLPGIEELERIAKDSILVGTADLCHHGIAYDSAVPHLAGEELVQYVHEGIDKGFQFLREGDFSKFLNNNFYYKSDGKDVCSIFHHLLHPFTAKTHSLRIIDTSSIFEGDPKPSWVAVALIELIGC